MASSRASEKAVAIVGGGISGLVAGARLASVGLDVALFDTGERACGGRLSSRTVEAPGGGRWEFDHSTQVGGDICVITRCSRILSRLAPSSILLAAL